MFLGVVNYPHMVDMLNTTGKRVRILRRERGLKQSAVVVELEKLGVEVGQTYISKIENDSADESARVIAGLAQVLNTTADYLLLLTDDPFIPGDDEEDAVPGASVETLPPDIRESAERLSALAPEDRETILRTLDNLMHFAERHQ